MIATVSGTLRGKVEVPSSKSVAHRMLICAALSGTPCTIKCHSINRDMEATADCLNALGANITYADGEFSVKPITQIIRNASLDCGESGSTLRFMLPVAAALGADATFLGHGRLPERPLSPLYEEMTAHGIQMSANGHMPLTCRGTLPAGTYTIDGGVSSQFISGLLMALPLTGGESRIIITGKMESASYIGLTLNALAAFGIKILRTDDGFLIPGGQKFTTPSEVTIEGDWSGAAFWLVAGTASSDAICCDGVDWSESAQGDRRIVDILRLMGANIETGQGYVIAYPAPLKAARIDCADVPDLVPVLAVAASKAEGTTVFENTRRLRIKESDRIESVLTLLHAAGIEASATENTLSVTGGKGHDCTCNPAGDHRMAMSAAVLASVHECVVRIEDAECTAKSYPDFWTHCSLMGGKLRIEN